MKIIPLLSCHAAPHIWSKSLSSQKKAPSMESISLPAWYYWRLQRSYDKLMWFCLGGGEVGDCFDFFRSLVYSTLLLRTMFSPNCSFLLSPLSRPGRRYCSLSLGQIQDHPTSGSVLFWHLSTSSHISASTPSLTLKRLKMMRRLWILSLVMGQQIWLGLICTLRPMLLLERMYYGHWSKSGSTWGKATSWCVQDALLPKMLSRTRLLCLWAKTPLVSQPCLCLFLNLSFEYEGRIGAELFCPLPALPSEVQPWDCVALQLTVLSQMMVWICRGCPTSIFSSEPHSTLCLLFQLAFRLQMVVWVCFAWPRSTFSKKPQLGLCVLLLFTSLSQVVGWICQSRSSGILTLESEFTLRLSFHRTFLSQVVFWIC